MTDVTQVLQRFTVRYRNALLANAALLVCLGAAIIALLSWRLRALRVHPLWAVGAPALFALIGAGLLVAWIARRWLSPRDTAAHLDRALGLQQRLMTAAEFSARAEPPALYEALLEDTARRLAPAQGRFPRPLDRTAGLLAVAALILLMWWPGAGRLPLPVIPKPQAPQPNPPHATPPPPPPQSQPQAQQPDQSKSQQSQQSSSGGDSSSKSSAGRQQGSGQSGQGQGQAGHEMPQGTASSGNQNRQPGSSSSSDGSSQRQGASRDQRTSSQQAGAQPAGRQTERSSAQSPDQQAGSSNQPMSGQRAQQSAGAQRRQVQGQQAAGRSASAQPQAGQGTGQSSSGDHEELKAEIQQLLKEVSGELKELQAQLAAAQDQMHPTAGTSTNPQLYEASMKLDQPLPGAGQMPMQLQTDAAQTTHQRAVGGTGTPSKQAAAGNPQMQSQSVQLSDDPQDETPASRQPVPPEYRSAFEKLQQRSQSQPAR